MHGSSGPPPARTGGNASSDVAAFLAGGRPGTAEQPDAVGYGPWFTASYEGECAGCWCVIDPGDCIRADGESGYLCEDCGDD